MRIAGFGVGFLLLVVGLSAQDAPRDAKAIITRAIKEHGGEEKLKAFTKIASKVKGKMMLSEIEFDFTSEITYVSPDLLRMTMNTNIAGQKLEMIQVMNGKKFLNMTNGKKQPMKPAVEKELKQAATLQDISTLVPLMSDRYKLKLLKDEKIGSDEVQVVLVESVDSRPVECSFDKKTGLLVRTVRTGLNMQEKEVKEETRISDFKAIEGVLVGHKMVSTHDGKPFMTATLTEGQILKATDPALFKVDD
jgi:hypothetical protein